MALNPPDLQKNRSEKYAKKPDLQTPYLSTTITRQRFLSKALDKNNSESALETKTYQLERLDKYSENVHKMTTDQIIEWINSFEDNEKRIKLAVNYLDKFVEFCKEDHPDIIIKNGRKKTQSFKTQTYQKKNTGLSKLHNNSFAGYFSVARAYLSQVGGIRLHNDDLASIVLPLSRKRGQYDDEQAEPLTAIQARAVLSHLRAKKTVAACLVMNDTGFRVTETGLIQEKHIHLEKEPCSIVLPPENAKGGQAGGTRFMRDSTALKVKEILTGDPEHFIFKKNKYQSKPSFRKNILEQLRLSFDKEGLTGIYEDTGRHKYNTHSWRKRCGTEFKRNNDEDLAHGYLRHTKYLAQYMQYTIQERILAFKRAEIDLAIEKDEYLEAKAHAKDRTIAKYEETIESLKEMLEKNKENQLTVYDVRKLIEASKDK